MSRERMWVLRVVIFGGILLLTLAVVSAAVLSVRQRLIRSRYERFHDDILAIPLRTTSYSQLQPLIDPWRRYARLSEPCNANFCDIEIQLEPKPILGSSLAYSDNVAQQIYVALLYAAGLRVTDTSAQIQVRNGYVWGIRYYLYVLVRRPLGQPNALPSLEAKLGTIFSQDPAHVIRSFKSDAPEFKLTAGHFIRFYETAAVRYSPYAPMAQIRQLTYVNFSCVAGIRACWTPAQLVPSVAGLEGTISGNEPGDFSCDDNAARVTSRDADGVAVAEVLANRLLNPELAPWGTQSLTLRMVQPLKRAEAWQVGTARQFETESFAAPPYYAPADLKIGERVIVVFLGEGEIDAQARALAVYGCGIMRDTPATRADVLAGTASDSRVPPYDAYRSPGTMRF